MSIFATLVIWGWNKPYLELSDFAENWNGESLQHMLDAKMVLAAVRAQKLKKTQKIIWYIYSGVFNDADFKNEVSFCFRIPSDANKGALRGAKGGQGGWNQ